MQENRGALIYFVRSHFFFSLGTIKRQLDWYAWLSSEVELSGEFQECGTCDKNTLK